VQGTRSAYALRLWLVVACIAATSCGGEEATLMTQEVTGCLERERIALTEMDPSDIPWAEDVEAAYGMTFFQFSGESATDAGTIIFSSDAGGPESIEQAMRRESARLEGKPLSEEEWDLYLDSESNVLVFWQTEPEEGSRSAVLGCLG
jgi:hypothetical protein